jgi:hypothetical protein
LPDAAQELVLTAPDASIAGGLAEGELRAMIDFRRKSQILGEDPRIQGRVALSARPSWPQAVAGAEATSAVRDLVLNKEVKMAKLYVFHDGRADSRHLYYASFDGSSWYNGDLQVPNVSLFDTPSAVSWLGGISVFHQGWYFVPAPGFVGGGEDSFDHQIWYNYSSDGVNWGRDTRIPYGYIFNG